MTFTMYGEEHVLAYFSEWIQERNLEKIPMSSSSRGLVMFRHGVSEMTCGSVKHDSRCVSHEIP